MNEKLIEKINRGEKILVLADFHHAGLLNSLILLFEGRFNGEVYRPIGTDWFKEGYWKVYDHPATVEQFLGINGATPDGTEPLNSVVGNDGSEVYLCQDIDSGKTNKAITLDGFFKRHFDIVIASIPDHILPFQKLSELHLDNPKVIFQIGNSWTTGAGIAPNIMASAIINNVPSEINFISYHQEFDLNIFSPVFDYPDKKISSFVNCFNVAPHFNNDWYLFKKVEELMSDWEFKVYGGQCRDGACHGTIAVAEEMINSRFVWHTKWGGDGYGHIIHNVPAVGRPLIVKKMYYKDKLAEPLLIDGETCIVIDGMDAEEIMNKINYYSEEVRYREMCVKAWENFKKVVDFEKEAEEIKLFLNNLK